MNYAFPSFQFYSSDPINMSHWCVSIGVQVFQFLYICKTMKVIDVSAMIHKILIVSVPPPYKLHWLLNSKRWLRLAPAILLWKGRKYWALGWCGTCNFGFGTYSLEYYSKAFVWFMYMKLQSLLYIILIWLHICDTALYRGTFLLSISQNSALNLDGDWLNIQILIGLSSYSISSIILSF